MSALVESLGEVTPLRNLGLGEVNQANNAPNLVVICLLSVALVHGNSLVVCLASILLSPSDGSVPNCR